MPDRSEILRLLHRAVPEQVNDQLNRPKTTLALVKEVEMMNDTISRLSAADARLISAFLRRRSPYLVRGGLAALSVLSHIPHVEKDSRQVDQITERMLRASSYHALELVLRLRRRDRRRQIVDENVS